ncbi:MAG: MFS transporter [Erythrobacter sp.]|jgi:GPH family glycoside/pentoside/hexuronide:cation symporter|nr:MFS transporter [Erythrobacter sp.]
MSTFAGGLPLRLKLVHGFGAVAFGVKDSGFSFFLLIFYNQVLGMDARLVSLALLIALLVDAVVDPIIGNLSDRTYTRWGRRLPWLYLAPIPLAIAWVMLWSPPSGEAPSFMGLVTIAITVRLLLSACEVPSISLVPELTQDYVERTTLFRFRFLSGWFGGLLMMLLAYGVFMPGAEGRLQQEGYVYFGMFGAALMAISVIGSAAGQHYLIARLPETRPPPFSFRGLFDEIFEAFSQWPFLVFAGGALAAYINQGMTFALTNYLNLFVWQLDAREEVLYALILGASVILMFFIVGPMHQRLGKPKSAAFAAIASMALGLAPYGLWMAGLWPQVGTTASTAAYFAFILFANLMGIVMMISATSMIAEVIEAFEEKTQRRAEGSFYSGNWLIQKFATGGGIWIAGQIIYYSQFATDAQPGTVPQAVLFDMVSFYALATMALAFIAALFLGRFPISREEHEARLLRLADRRRDALAASPASSEPAPAFPEGDTPTLAP